MKTFLKQLFCKHSPLTYGRALWFYIACENCSKVLDDSLNLLESK